MSAPAREVEDHPGRMFLVEVDKAIDATSPLWRRAYFYAVYRPFIRLSFNIFGVPTAGEIKADGSVTWREKIALFLRYQDADDACKSEFYVVTPMDFGTTLPEESIQYHGQIRPRASKPSRYHKRLLPFTAKRVSTIHEEEAGVESAIARIQKLTQKLKASAPL